MILDRSPRSVQTVSTPKTRLFWYSIAWQSPPNDLNAFVNIEALNFLPTPGMPQLVVFLPPSSFQPHRLARLHGQSGILRLHVRLFLAACRKSDLPAHRPLDSASADNEAVYYPSSNGDLAAPQARHSDLQKTKPYRLVTSKEFPSSEYFPNKDWTNSLQSAKSKLSSVAITSRSWSRQADM
ncbi:hypothetical protein K443DRAFT_7390 [Laccaria amethystina LaAM-08-1]|jgi:hypothetical protein|uniref:Uncharacterized protein n=1 Tax=Laccaria amethystina LaAM-08-1 TaxID=1095629 RepID=A0A0C9X6W8_9AGAR|nr:hypothetical protein K443DRAFT_7390 [Laccaria amethystina LaAM-08-1]